MAGRIRSHKPEIIEDAVLAALSSDAFRLFMGAKSIADDHGNLRAEPAFLLGQVFWARAPSVPIEEILAELSEARVFELYEQSGQKYAHIRKWEKHERIDNAGAPRVPLPPGWTCKEETWSTGSGANRRTRSRWVSTPPVASSKTEPSAPTDTTATTRTGTTCHGGKQSGDDLPPLDLDHDHDHDHEGDGAVAAPGPLPSASQRATGVAEAIATHRDLFESAPFGVVLSHAVRIDRMLGRLETRDVWTDLSAEVDGWVSYVRGKFPGQPALRQLNEVERKADFRIRDRPAQATVEREKSRGNKSTVLDVTDIGDEIDAADRELTESRARRDSETRVSPAQVAGNIGDALKKFRRGAA